MLYNIYEVENLKDNKKDILFTISEKYSFDEVKNTYIDYFRMNLEGNIKDGLINSAKLWKNNIKKFKELKESKESLQWLQDYITYETPFVNELIVAIDE